MAQIVSLDDLAHHIGALVAKEQAGEHLNLKIGTQLGVAIFSRNCTAKEPMANRLFSMNCCCDCCS